MKNGIKLVVFDLTNVLIRGNQFQKMMAELGVLEPKEAEFIGDLCVKKDAITPIEWVETEEKILKASGKAFRKEMEAALENYELMPGAKEIVDYLQKEGYHIAILTGQVDHTTKRVAEELGIDTRFASPLCHCVYRSDGFLQRITFPSGNADRCDTSTMKFFTLVSFARWLDVQLDEVACVGQISVYSQGVLFEKTGHGIALESAPEELKERAWKVVPDLLGLKEIL